MFYVSFAEVPASNMVAKLNDLLAKLNVDTCQNLFYAN